MLKIGLLGSDSEYAARFSELLNLPEQPRFLANTDARVVALWGQEATRTQQVAQQSRIETIVDEPAAMLGLVDAVICVACHGDRHLELVRPFFQERVPTFVHKPLAIDADDARTIVALAAQSRTPFSSFSPFCFCADVQQFLQCTRQLGGVCAGHYSGPAVRRTACSGVIVYAIHAIELMLMTQGVGVQWVHALEGPAVDGCDHGALVALCAWSKGMVGTIELPVDAQDTFHVVARGRKGAHVATLNGSDCDVAGMQQILTVLSGGASPVPPTAMIEAIQIGAAIDLSLNEARRVYLYEV